MPSATLENPLQSAVQSESMQLESMQLELALTDQEASTLRRCEAVIEEGRQTFLRVGSALLTIRDSRLYRETHPSFEAYLQAKWDMGKTNAYRMMAAVEVVRGIEEAGAPASPIGDAILPANEAQARPLSQLPEAQQPEAWAKAVEAAEGQPTAAEVQAVVTEMLPPKAEVPETPALFGEEEVAGDKPAGAGEQPEGMSDEEWEASARPAGTQELVQALTPDGDNAPPEEAAQMETASPSGLAATPMTRPEPPDAKAKAPEPAKSAPVKVELSKPAPAPAAPPAPAPAAPPALPPGWTTAMVPLGDFAKAQEMGLWPLASAIAEVEELRATIQTLQNEKTEPGEPAAAEPAIVPVSPAMAMASAAAGVLAEMIQTASVDVLTRTDTQLLDELFPDRQQALPEHIVALLLIKRLRQVRGETQQS